MPKSFMMLIEEVKKENPEFEAFPISDEDLKIN